MIDFLFDLHQTNKYVLYLCWQFQSDKVTMRNKYISKQSNEILVFFNEQDRHCFDYELAKKALPKSNDSALRELLSDMTRRGLLMRVKRGLYYIIPYEQDAETFMPDWHLLAEYLVQNAKHYIGYYSALQIHNLITQPSLKEQIVVSKQIRPSMIKIKDVPFQFIYHNEKHFFGTKKIWIDKERDTSIFSIPDYLHIPLT